MARASPVKIHLLLNIPGHAAAPVASTRILATRSTF